MNKPPAELTITPDGYFSMKDIMRIWGHKNGLMTDEVLKAVSHSLSRLIQDEHRARFLVYQDDHRGDAIYLRVPAAMSQ